MAVLRHRRSASKGRGRRLQRASGCPIPRDFKITIDDRGEALWVVIDGELDIGTAPLLDEKLVQIDTGDVGLIVLDLAGVSFIDSEGLCASC